MNIRKGQNSKKPRQKINSENWFKNISLKENAFGTTQGFCEITS